MAERGGGETGEGETGDRRRAAGRERRERGGGGDGRRAVEREEQVQAAAKVRQGQAVRMRSKFLFCVSLRPNLTPKNPNSRRYQASNSRSGCTPKSPQNLTPYTPAPPPLFIATFTASVIVAFIKGSFSFKAFSTTA